MRAILFATLLCATAATSANPFPDGNAQTGEKLFKQYQCASCHVAMLGGDGSAMFTRADRKVRSVPELIEQMNFCTGNVGVNLTARDEQHLGAFLNRYYKLR
ncbi:MAG: cytochrome c [Gallionella sp.]|nr:cytochrome c [Gallionella sp.]